MLSDINAPAASPGIPIYQRPIWDRALAAYDEARTLELEYDKAVWKPAWDIEQAGGPAMPADIAAHMERLMDVREAAETVLMPLPTETPEQSLLKLLIAMGDGRECFGWLDDILEDAKRFTGRTGR